MEKNIIEKNTKPDNVVSVYDNNDAFAIYECICA